MQNLAESKTSFLTAQQFCQIGAMSSTPTSSSIALTDSNSSTKLHGNPTSANLLDNHTLEQLENFQQLLATLDPTSLQASIYLNQLASSVSSTSDHSTTSTITTTATSAVHPILTNKNNICNTSPTSTTSIPASVSNSGVETNDYTNAATELQQQLMETLMQAGNNTNMLSSVTNNTFNNNLFGSMANSTNNNFVDWAELLLNNSTNADTKAFNNISAMENNSVFEELGTEGLTNLINNLISNGGFNNQQWEELNATANAVLNSDIQQQVNTTASLVKSIKQQQPKYTSVAAPSSTDRHSSTSGRSSPASNAIEQQLINLFNNVTPAELLSSLSGNNISNNNLSAVAAAAGLTSSQIANAAAQMFSAVSGNNDLSNLIHNSTTNSVNLNQNTSISNSNSDNNATAAAVASLLAASSGSFALSRSPSKSLDSYCEICDKNLCNRYFLKTHKLKKHGISEDNITGSPIKTTITGGLFSQNSATDNNENIASQSFRSAPSSFLKNEIKNEHVLNDVDSDGPIAKMPKLSVTSNASSSSNTAALLRLSTAPTTTATSVSLNSVNNSNVSFLNGKSTIDFLTAAEQFQKQSKIAGLTFDESVATAAALLETNNSASNFNCDICNKDFDSNLNLIQHKCAQHAAVLLSSALVASGNGSDSPQSSSSVGGSDSAVNTGNNNSGNNFLTSLSQLPFFLTPEIINHFASAEVDPQIVLGALTKFSSSVENALNGVEQTLTGNLSSAKSSTLKRQYTSTSKNYCDLCNKEVCNKYFLRTHMLKMHQIVIDENKSIIAKIDTTEKEKTGAISFRCDVCLIELKTRQELKLHKNEVHGGLATFTNTCRPLTPTTNTQKNSLVGLSNTITPIHKISSVSLDPTIIKQQYYDTGASNNSEDGESENGEKCVSNLLIKDEPIDDDKTNNNNNINNNNLKPSVIPPSNVEIFLNNTQDNHIENNDIKQEINLETDTSSVGVGENIPSSSSSTSTFETNNLPTILTNGNDNNLTLNAETSEHCRYCEEYFPSISKLQQHTIDEHSQEIFKQLAAAAAIETSGSTEHQQLITSLDNEELITQVAIQMQQVNQQQQVSDNCWPSSVTNAAAKLALAKYF